MTEQYSIPKTVRYTSDTWQLIKLAARNREITTSKYIRQIVTSHVVSRNAEMGGTTCDNPVEERRPPR